MATKGLSNLASGWSNFRAAKSLSTNNLNDYKSIHGPSSIQDSKPANKNNLLLNRFKTASSPEKSLSVSLSKEELPEKKERPLTSKSTDELRIRAIEQELSVIRLSSPKGHSPASHNGARCSSCLIGRRKHNWRVRDSGNVFHFP